MKFFQHSLIGLKLVVQLELNCVDVHIQIMSVITNDHYNLTTRAVIKATCFVCIVLSCLAVEA
jgi:hypothetical protein